MCSSHNLSIPELAWANELENHTENQIKAHLRKVCGVMTAAIDTGIATEDYLPGELHVPRRAKSLHDRLEHHPERDSPSDMSWLRLYAIAVNETNASCGRVVTAPTNGACGTLPAVLA